MKKSYFKILSRDQLNISRYRWLSFLMFLCFALPGFAQTYCAPIYSNGCSSGDYIGIFAIPSISFSHDSGGCNNSHNDYTEDQNLQFSLIAGEGTVYTVSNDEGSMQIKIWIDFDNNSTFDTAEEVSHAIGNDATITQGIITIPASTTVGTYRMRVSTRYNQAPTPCNTGGGGWGESNDYMVEILEPLPCSPPSELSLGTINSNSAVLNYNNDDNNSFFIEWSDATFGPGEGIYSDTGTGSSFTFTNLEPNTTYYFYINKSCNGIGESSTLGPYTFTTTCEAVTAFSESFEGTDNNLPDCFSFFASDVNNISLSFSTTASNISSGARSLSALSYLNGNAVYIVSPLLTNIGANSHRLVFYAKGTTATKLDVGVSATNANTTNVNYIYSTEAANGLTSNMKKYVVNFDQSYSGSFIVIRITYNSTFISSYIDDIVWEAIPLCADVTSVQTTGISSNSATVSWTPQGTETAWQYAIGSTTDQDPEVLGAIDVTGTLPTVTISDLEPNTTYKVWIRSNCTTEFGAWHLPITFKTNCEAELPDTVTQEFTTITPDCWSMATGVLAATSTITPSTSGWSTKAFANVSLTPANTAASINLYGTKNNWLISQPIDLGTTAGVYRLSYKYAITNYNSTGLPATIGSHKLSVVVSTDGGATWSDTNIIKNYTGPATYSNTGLIERINLTNYSGIIKIAFVATTSTTAFDIDFFLDDFKVESIPNCQDVSSIAASNITSNSANVSFSTNGTETAWQYYLGEASETEASDSGAIDLTATQFSLSNLESNTTYKVWIRANCGSGNFGNWSEAFLVKTHYTCGELFTDSATEPTNYTNNSILTHTYFPQNPGEVINVNFTEFSTESSWDGLMIYDGPNTNSPIISSGFVGTNATCPTGAWNGTSTYSPVGITIESTHATGALTFVFRSDGSTNFSGWSATVECVEMPDCLRPTLLVSSAVTANNATIGWTPQGNETSWQVAYTSDNTITSPEDLVAETVTTSTTILNDLNPVTTYKVWVKAVCDTDESTWLGPITFKTECSSEPAPTAVQNFSTFLPNCWSMATGVLTTTSTLTPITSAWYISEFGNTGDNSAASINLYGSKNDWLISHAIDLGTTPGQYRLSYKYAITDYYSTDPIAYDTHKVNVVISTDGGNTWSNLNSIKEYSGDIIVENSNVGILERINLTNYSGVIKVAFVATTSTVETDAMFYVDDFSIEALPLCSDVNTVTATPTSTSTANLSWTFNGNATAWQYVIGEATDTDPNDLSPETVSTTNVELTNLTSGTTYKIWVRSICDGEQYGFWSNPPATLTTPLTCGDTFYDNGGSTGDYPNNSNQTTVIFPDVTGNAVSVTFTEFNTEEAYDYILIYDGPSATEGTLISSDYIEEGWTDAPTGSWNGNLAEDETFTSTHPTGALTFVFISDGSGAFSGWEATIDCTPLSIKESASTDFRIYPNPVKDILNISNNNNITNVAIFNLLGQQVYNESIDTTNTQIDMSTLSTGTYLVKIKSNDSVQTVKVIKQ